FCWMFVDAIELSLILYHIFKIEQSRIVIYYLYSYGIPLIIVMITAILFLQGYGTAKYCWLTQAQGFIWIFGVPFLILIITNITFLIISMCIINKHGNNEKQVRNKSR
ncbi:unnamed protein product, partial [Didymodactylos carnosus]